MQPASLHVLGSGLQLVRHPKHPASPGATPTYILGNEPHYTLINLNMHKWGKKRFQKKLPINPGSHQPSSDLEVGSFVINFLVCFTIEFSIKF